jgi:glucose-1-phosphate adenylyltransferase
MRVDTSSLGLSAEEAGARPFLASMGIYVFKYDQLEQLLTEDLTWVDFGREIIPGAIKTRNVQAHVFNGYWEDIGTISAFYRANLDLTSKIPKFNLFDAEAPVFTRARYLPPSKIEESQIQDSIISDGCIISGAAITNSVIGLRSRIAKGVRVDASFVMGADYYQTIEEMRDEVEAGIPRLGIGEGTIINRTIVDKNARIGSSVRLLNEARVTQADGENGSYFIRDGIIIVPKNAVIGDGTVV